MLSPCRIPHSLRLHGMRMSPATMSSFLLVFCALPVTRPLGFSSRACTAISSSLQSASTSSAGPPWTAVILQREPLAACRRLILVGSWWPCRTAWRRNCHLPGPTASCGFVNPDVALPQTSLAPLQISSPQWSSACCNRRPSGGCLILLRSRLPLLPHCLLRLTLSLSRFPLSSHLLLFRELGPVVSTLAMTPITRAIGMCVLAWGSVRFAHSDASIVAMDVAAFAVGCCALPHHTGIAFTMVSSQSPLDSSFLA